MKILILTAKAGGGHLAMATSLHNYLSAHMDKSVTSKIVRLNEFSGPGFETFVNRSYIWLVNNASRSYAYFYNRLDRTNQKKLMVNRLRVDNGKSPRISYAFQRGAIAKLKKIIKAEKPDLVISCYHYCNILAYKARHKYKLDFKIINVFADYLVNSVYYCNLVDAHICSSATDEERLLEVGVPPEKIYRYGIPVNEKFFTSVSRDELFPYFHLPKRPTILILGGAFGGGRLMKVVRAVIKEELPYNLVVLCGTNKKLRRRLEKLTSAFYNLYPVGYTQEIEKYMDLADILVSKVGGNGISEAFAKRLPVIMVNPLPGQEQFNADYLEAREMALYARSPEEVVKYINLLKDNPDEALRLKDNIDRYFNKDATKNICELAINLVEEGRRTAE